MRRTSQILPFIVSVWWIPLVFLFFTDHCITLLETDASMNQITHFFFFSFSHSRNIRSTVVQKACIYPVENHLIKVSVNRRRNFSSSFLNVCLSLKKITVRLERRTTKRKGERRGEKKNPREKKKKKRSIVSCAFSSDKLVKREHLPNRLFITLTDINE